MVRHRDRGGNDYDYNDYDNDNMTQMASAMATGRQDDDNMT